ncbi:pilus assembly protein (plasmid) [Skermanella mucosa]|uniref:TadE/TadG family type IV pilus assembly protein n=1 Tax=Skermanella mucosa TaxID=1789672 RepID=UPI00192A94EB|nr:TadE/TadG family type IV pilus assembly protein [Skermanella mucosa]UEM25105.1 pilus assembly protein [Skermanella mucosa]
MTGAAKTVRGALGNRRGVAALEFAAVAPVLILLLVGMVDMTSYVLAALRLERVASGTADVGAQFDRLRDGMTVVQGNEVGVLFLAAEQIARPLDLAGNGSVIITCVADQGGGPVVMWQRRSGRAAADGIGAAGGAATLPAGFALRYGESALFVEVHYTLHPYVFSVGWLTGSDEAVDLRRMAVYRPRFGTLTELER